MKSRHTIDPIPNQGNSSSDNWDYKSFHDQRAHTNTTFMLKTEQNNNRTQPNYPKKQVDT